MNEVNDYNCRTALLLGNESVERLAGCHVLIVGVGGVGSYVAEAVARAGVGRMTLVDADTVAPSNVNRQLPALHSTVGQSKAEVMKRRILDINPDCRVTAVSEFVTADGAGKLLDETSPDYMVDAIDSVAPKVALIEAALRRRIKFISSMGAGGRIDPSQVRYADLSDTYHDGLARAVRQRLKRDGVRGRVPVVFSTEQPRRSSLTLTDEMPNKVSSFGTVSWLPSVFGLYLAAAAVRTLVGQH